MTQDTHILVLYVKKLSQLALGKVKRYCVCPDTDALKTIFKRAVQTSVTRVIHENLRLDLLQYWFQTPGENPLSGFNFEWPTLSNSRQETSAFTDFTFFVFQFLDSKYYIRIKTH